MKVRDRRRSSGSFSLSEEVTDIEGAAHLCVSEAGDWFQGHFVSADQSSYSISGTRTTQDTIPESDSNHNGIQENVYEVVVVDHEQGTRYTFSKVVRKTSPKCQFQSKKFIFESDTLYKGQRADMVIQNFLPRLVGQNLNVHAGRMTMTVHKQPEPLIKWAL